MNVLTALAGIGRHFRKLPKLTDLAATLAFETGPIAQLEKVFQAGDHLGERLSDAQGLGRGRGNEKEVYWSRLVEQGAGATSDAAKDVSRRRRCRARCLYQ